MSWPIITVSGVPHRRGLDYGRQAAERIHRSVAVYRGIFAEYGDLDWGSACAEAEKFVAPISQYAPHLLEEIEGIAEGAGLRRRDILALNTRNELMFAAGSPSAAECTSLAVTKVMSSLGTPLLALNWDWKPGCLDTTILLACYPDDGPSFLTLAEAGHLAKIGVNDAGVALATNTLVSSGDGVPDGLPYHALLRLALEQRSLDAAIDMILSKPRACSGNFLFASAEEVADLEVGSSQSGRVSLQLPHEGYLTHANHFRDDAATPAEGGPMESVVNSRLRDFRAESSLRAVLAARGTIVDDDLTSILRNHIGAPDSICCHPNDEHHPARQYITVSSVLLDPANGRLSATEGPPCAAPHERYEWPSKFDLVATARSTGDAATRSGR